MTRFLICEHKGQRPDREAKVYHITDIEDNHEVHLFENDELIEMRIYYKSSRASVSLSSFPSANGIE